MPKGLLIDYGGTLVEEYSSDERAGNEWLFARAAYRPPGVTIDQVLDRARIVSNEIAARRDDFQIETPWAMSTRLIHEFFGIRFEDSMADLELGFWKASVKTRPIPGAFEALEELHRCKIPMGVVSNCSFGSHVLRYELAKHGLAEHLRFVMVSAEYSVRKPNVLLFETAAAKLGRKPEDIWFIGDRLETDIAGAKSACMTTVWFQPPPGASSERADISVENWSEFLSRFRQSR